MVGEKLQALIDGECISHGFAEGLSSAQKQAIEALDWSQVWAIREAREKVGVVTNSFVI